MLKPNRQADLHQAIRDLAHAVRVYRPDTQCASFLCVPSHTEDSAGFHSMPATCARSVPLDAPLPGPREALSWSSAPAGFEE